MFILAMYKKVFRKNIPAIIFGAVLLVFNISNVHGAGFYGGEEFQINTSTTNDQEDQGIRVLDNGNFVVTWKSNAQNGVDYDIVGQIFDSSGSKVGSEFLVNSSTINEDDGAQLRYFIAVLSNGNFIVVWHSYDQNGDHWDVYAQIFDQFGTKVGAEFQVNTYSSDFYCYPSVAAFNNGGFVVVWHSTIEVDNLGVYAQIFDSSGTKIGSEFQVNTYVNHYQGWPGVAVFDNNNFIVHWASAEQDGSGDGVYAQIFDQVGNKVEDEFRVNTYTMNHQGHRGILFLNSNNFVIKWVSQEQDGSGDGIYAQVFDQDGNKIGDEFRVNTYATNHQHGGPISMLNNDNFVITWVSEEQDGSGYGVYAQIFNSSGAKLGNEFRVNTYISNDQYRPSIAVLNDDSFVIVWDSNLQDGSGRGVYAQFFDSSGNKLGGEFQVNIYVTNDQVAPSVDVLNNGDFVVVWSGEGQGDTSGIFGRIFHLNTIPTISGLTKSGLKNTALTFNKTDFTNLFTDADGHSMTKIKITSLPNNGDLKLLSSGAVSEDQEIDVDDIENLVFDPDKDWTGTAIFGWQGYDGTDYSDAGVVTIKVNDGSSESGEWWPVVTGGALTVIGGIVTVATTLITYKLKKCCFKKQDDGPANRNSMGNVYNFGEGNVNIQQSINTGKEVY